MFRYKWIGFMIAVSSLFQNIGFDPRHEGFEKGRKEYKIKKIAKIDFLESSGLESDEPGNFWTHGDSGGDPSLSQFDLNGQDLDIQVIPGAKNIDWEDIARDDQGNFYIGDFGNNRNGRRDLKIYKWNNTDIDSILFSYPDQTAFPPPEQERNFDCEAFFWYNDHLYLFSKNRGNDLVKAYRLSDSDSKQTAVLLDTITIHRQVTAADINDVEDEFSLLTYGMVYTFSLQNPDKPFSAPLRATRFTKGGQSEAILYMGDEIIISNEVGKIYRMQRKD